MSDHSSVINLFGPDFGKSIVEAITYTFLIGLIPGYYISYIRFRNTKVHPFLALLFSLIIGFVFGCITAFIIISSYPANPIYGKYWDAFSNMMPYLIALEVLVVIIHFFYFQKRVRKPVKKEHR